MRRQLASIAIAVTTATSLLSLQAAPAAAECSFVPAWPHITTAIRSAREIVVGTIVTDFAQSDLHLSADQAPRDYALRIIEVLRGPRTPGDLMDVQDLLPNWPWTKSLAELAPYPSCSSLHTAPGETIALALDALMPRQRLANGNLHWIQPATRYNAMGVLRAVLPGRERVTLRELRDLAALPETSTLAAPDAQPDRVPVLVVLWIGASLFVLRAIGPRRRRTRHPSS